MNRFNLTFTGEILPGYDPNRVRVAFGKLFQIKEPARVEQFFAGQPITLRRNLDRKTAADLYAKLHKMGADVALEKIAPPEPEVQTDIFSPAQEPSPTPEPTASNVPENRGMNHEIRETHPGLIDQSWPVRTARIDQKSRSKKAKTAEAQRQAEEAAKQKSIELEAQRQAEEAAKQKTLERESQRQAEEAAKHKALELEAQRQAEEAAKQKTLELEAQRQADEAAKQKALELEAKRQADEAARQKTLELEAQRQADEAAKHKALEREAERQADEAAKHKALELEAQRQADEAAKQKTLEREAKRQADEAARQKTLELEAQRQAEEAAKHKALEREAQRQADEAARQKTLEREAQRQAEEAAKQKTLERDAQREAEEAAKQKTLEREAKRQAEEAAKHKALEREAQREAEEAAQQKALEREAQRQAEEAAKQKTLEREAQRQAEEAAQQKTLELEAQRQAEEAAQLQAEQQRRHDEQFARLKEQKTAVKAQREALEKAAREKATVEALQLEVLEAEQRRLVAEEAARVQSQKLAKLRNLEDSALAQEMQSTLASGQNPSATSEQQNGSGKLSKKSVPHSIGRSKTVRSAVKTSHNVPVRDDQSRDYTQPPARPARQPGAPNFFNLRPFRNTAEVRGRAERSRQRKQITLATSLFALIALVGLSVRFFTLPQEPEVKGPRAMAANSQYELLLAVGDRIFLHDRAGVGERTVESEDLGLAELSRPMAFISDNEILLLGHSTAGNSNREEREDWRLMRCQLTSPNCQPQPLPSLVETVSGLAVDPRLGSIYVADSAASKLIKVTLAGELAAQVDMPIPTRAIVRLRSGLIYINSALAPAISVLRPDNQAFGEQLDEILLLPPPAIAAEQSRVTDFVWSEGSWWVALYNPQTMDSGVYRFDDEWNLIDQIAINPASHADQLMVWADKILILDRAQGTIARFNANGKPEVPLVSNLLQAYIEGNAYTRSLNTTLWLSALGAVAILALVSLVLASLYRLRSLVYRPGLEKGAESVSENEHFLTWMSPATRRETRLKRLAIVYLLLSVTALGAAASLAASPGIVAALAIGLTGPALGLFLFQSSRCGHIGLLQDKLILVDHSNLYHLGGGPRILYRRHFLMVDDVVVFTGTSFLPVFDMQQLHEEITPVAQAGIKVDRKTVLIKLIQSRHPLVKGAIATMASTMVAALVIIISW